MEITQALLGESWAVVGRYWPLIIFISALRMVALSGLEMGLTLLAFVLGVVLTILVYGRLVAHLDPDRSPAVLTILQENGIHYLVAMVIIGIPGGAAGLLLRGLDAPLILYVVLSGLVNAAVAVLTLYVLPVVFLHRAGVAAVLAGVSAFLSHAAASAGIAVVVVAAHVVTRVGALLVLSHPSSWTGAAALGAAAVALYLLFVAFTAASRVLLGTGVRVQAGGEPA